MPGTATPILVPAKLDPGESVSIRMYRRILGDCFLLTHTKAGKNGKKDRFHALIDCGALQRIGSVEDKEATEASLKSLGEAIDDLLAHVKGKLDLVIATHEHYDHLSGFMKYHEKFEKLEIGRLWLAWTENDVDDLANKIRQGLSRGLTALAALSGRNNRGLAFGNFGIGEVDEDSEEAAKLGQISNLMQFYGEIDPPSRSPSLGFGAKKDEAKPVTLAVGARPLSCAQALLWLKRTTGEANISYLEPGQQIAFGLGDRLRATVLGPPRSEKRLLQLDPKGKGEDKEVYLTRRDQIEALIATLSRNFDGRFGAKPEDEEEGDDLTEFFTPVETDLPFAERFSRNVDPESDDPELRPRDKASRRYYAKDQEDRRIDGDWLGAAETLALKIDGDVNNTSLALAIEVPGRQVLLFPADAQVGNWLSWHDQTYPSKPGVQDPAGEPAADLLARVVLYKVGHHGSHNATAKAKGLELMTNPHLAAMIPVVEKVAKEQATKNNKDGWAMPYPDLHTRLQAKTAGRILKGDGDPKLEKAAFKTSIFEPAYDSKLPTDPRWVSLTLKGAKP